MTYAHEFRSFPVEFSIDFTVEIGAFPNLPHFHSISPWALCNLEIRPSIGPKFPIRDYFFVIFTHGINSLNFPANSFPVLQQ
jgi:hypothetical protein